jgi:hypothetical protein
MPLIQHFGLRKREASMHIGVTLSFEGVCFNLGGSSSNCVFAELLQ